MNSSVDSHFKCEVECEVYFYTRMWINPRSKLPPQGPGYVNLENGVGSLNGRLELVEARALILLAVHWTGHT